MAFFKPGKRVVFSSRRKVEEFEHLFNESDISLDDELYPPESGKMSPDEIELAFYEKFFFSKDMEPYPVQEEAFNHIFAEHNVLITVPTGTGKTMMAKAGLFKALYSNQTAIYTTPLRALTEEKYRELCEDFGEKYVGFATGDYRVNAHAPIQVMVAEILWNKIFNDPLNRPADIVIMDEGHYFNSPDRGYVWEESIIGLHPRTQLVVLSATVGNPQQFCQWCYLVRRVPMHLVESHQRRIPLTHLYLEQYLIETVKQLYSNEEYPVIIFSFGRRLCYERAHLLKSCRRFTTPEEQEEIKKIIDPIIIPRGIGEKFRMLLMHGIGVHHAGVLPAYKQLVEELTLKKLVKFVVSTETIAAGINLPAKRVLFPELRKVIRKKPRLLLPAEYHQMAGRAGRPQFDKEGIAITLAPEGVVHDFRKEIRDAERSRYSYDEAKIKKRAYSRAKVEAQRRGDVTWDPDVHKKLVEGKPAPLRSHTKITAEQILAIGLPRLSKEELPGSKLVEAEIAKKKAEEARIKAEEEAREKEREAKKKAKEEAEEKKTQKEENSSNPPEKKRDKSGFSRGNNPFGQLLASLEKNKKEPSKGEKEEKNSSKEPANELEELQAKVAQAKAEEEKAVSIYKQALEEIARQRALEKELPAYMNLHIRTVIDNLFLDERERLEAHKELVKITNNLKALGVLDEEGRQIRGEMIGELSGIDGPFVYFCLMNYELKYEESRELVEFLVDHDVIQRMLDRKLYDQKRDWVRQRLRERRKDDPQVSWEDVEREYDEKFPRELSPIEKIHQEFLSKIPHPELHAGKRFNNVWATMEDEDKTFMEFVEEHSLELEEGNLFSYLARVMKVAKKLYEVTLIPDFFLVESRIRAKLAVLDERILSL